MGTLGTRPKINFKILIVPTKEDINQKKFARFTSFFPFGSDIAMTLIYKVECKHWKRKVKYENGFVMSWIFDQNRGGWNLL